MTSANPRRDAPVDDQIDVSIEDTPGRMDVPPPLPKPVAAPQAPPKPAEATPLVPTSQPPAAKDKPAEEPPASGKKGKHKLDLVHKKTVKITWWEWLWYAVHLVVLYGWLILMMYLLLKATKDDARATQGIYFALFLFTVLVITVVVLIGERQRKKRLREAELLKEPEKVAS